MITPILAINMQVRCSDGCVHENVKMFVRDGKKVFLDCDDCEITEVECIEKATSLVSPVQLLAAMQQCAGVNNG